MPRATESTCRVLFKDIVLGANKIHGIDLTGPDYTFTQQEISTKLAEKDIHSFSCREMTYRLKVPTKNIDIEDQGGNIFDRREMLVKSTLKTTKHHSLAAFNIPV